MKTYIRLSAQANTSQSGNVLFYILICVALLGVLTYTMSSGGQEQAAGASAFRMSEDIKAQAQGIRSALLECVLVQNAPYPAQPGSGDLADAQCDMASGGAQSIFTAQSARALPLAPNPFGDWKYTNTTNSFIKASLIVPSNRASSATVRNVLVGLAESFHAPQTGASTHIYQNQEVCIIETGTVAEFHVCLKSSTGLCGKAAPNNQSVGNDPCNP
ncbi:MAG TPA: hypothetical protein VGF14_06480 [Alphaproteobacteria bacterium]